jgi:hemolysin III
VASFDIPHGGMGGEYQATAVASDPPRFRGLSHSLAFFVALPLGFALAMEASTSTARVAALLFGLSVAAMFGTSSLFHRISWSPIAKNRMAVIDHAMIYGLIAGTYTPFALLVLRTSWGIPVLVLVCAGGAAAITAKVIWRNPPPWVAVATCFGLGWVALLVFPQIAAKIGVGGTTLLVAGGVAYTVGAVVYALRRPDPFPRTFGYHEIFHAFVVVAVACQYAAVAFFVLPRA